MSTTLHNSFSIKTCGNVILFKVVLASSKVIVVTSPTPSLEIQIVHDLVPDQ